MTALQKKWGNPGEPVDMWSCLPIESSVPIFGASVAEGAMESARWWLQAGFGKAYVVLVILELAACGGGSGGGNGNEADVRVVFTRSGTGQVNAEPLWPMRPGLSYGSGNGQCAVTRWSSRFGTPWLLEQCTNAGEIWESDSDWNQGRHEAFWSVEDEGLVLRASSAQEVRPVPLLIIPAQVRDGMEWEVRGDGGAVVLAGEVTGGDVRETQFGRHRVWRVRIDLAATETTDAFQWKRDFVEGRGPLDSTFSVVPLEDQEDAPLPRVAMAPTGQEIPALMAGVRSFSALEDPAAGRMEVHLGLWQPAPPTEQNGPDLIRIRPRRMAFSVDDAGHVESLLKDQVNAPYYLPHVFDFGICQDSASTAFLADGSRARVPMTEWGLAIHGWLNPPKYIPGTEPEVEPIFPGAFAGVYGTDPPGSAEGFEIEEGSLRGTHPFLGEVDPLGFKAFWVLQQGPYDDRRGDTYGYGPWTHALGGTDVQRVMAATPLREGAGMDVVMRLDTWMAHATLDDFWRLPGQTHNYAGFARDSSLDGPYVDEVVAVLRPDNSRDLYEVSEDGVVWRLEVEDGVLNRYLLAAVELPHGERAIGVVPMKDKTLQVWTEDGYARVWTVPVFGVGPVEMYVDDARLHTYRLEAPEPSGGEPVPDVLGLHAQASGRDVLLCLPAGRSLGDTPWTLGGQPTRQVRQSDRCLLLVRPWDVAGSAAVDGVSPTLVPTAADAWHLEGSIPGVGAVELAFAPGTPEPIPDDISSRHSGGFNSQDVLAGPGLGHVQRVWRDTTGTFLMDLNRDGYWTVTSDPGDKGICQDPDACIVVAYFDWTEPLARTFLFPWNTIVGEAVPKLVYLNGLPSITKDGQTWVFDADAGPMAPTDPAEDGVTDELDCTLVTSKVPPMESFDWQCSASPSAPPMQLSSYAGPGVALPAEDMTFYSGMTAPHIWRIDWRYPGMDVVPVPHPEHFPAGVEIADGTCAADGACFLLLRSPDASHSTTKGETLGKGIDADPYAEGKPPVDIEGSIPWSIVRVDRKGLGLHEVIRGVAHSTAEVQRLRADDSVLVVLDRASVQWRGFRDEEPTQCAECSAQQRCLLGMCDCSYRHVTADGTCTDDASPETYATCPEALAAGEEAGSLVRIDNDGQGPAPAVHTRCDDAEGWTPVPARWDPRTAWMSFELTYDFVNCYPAVPPYAPQWTVTSSESSLHGEFDVAFSFGPPGKFDTWLALEPLDRFDPQTGLFDARSQGAARPLEEGEVAVSLGTDGLVRVVNAGSAGKTVQPTHLRLVRDGGGIIRLLQDDTVVWTSGQPMKHDYRMVAVESAPVRLEGVRWAGTTPDFCIAQCNGAVCGDDGCGGTCGLCGTGATCVGGSCVCDPPLYGDGSSCVTPTGSSAEYPAASCAQAWAVAFPWSSSPWIDTDGPGGEPPFKQPSCEALDPWTRPPAAFLGPAAILVADAGSGTCMPYASLPSPPPDPTSAPGGTAHLDGNVLSAGTSAVATFRALKNEWSVMVLLTPGAGGQRAAVHVDDLAGFDPVSLAWTGWMAECGGGVPSPDRFTLWRDDSGTWARQGSSDPALVWPPDPATPMFTLKRTATGLVVVTLGGGTAYYTTPVAVADLVRVVGEVQGGTESQVILTDPKWQ